MDEDNNIKNDYLNKEIKDSKDIELLKNEIIEKNKLIDNLQKENKELIKKNDENNSLLNKEIKNIKNEYEIKLNSLREYFQNEINSLKEEISKNKNTMDNKEKKKRKNEIKVLKEDLNDLCDKFNNFQRICDNKMEFIESSLTKLMEKEGIKKDMTFKFLEKLEDIFSEKNDKKICIDKKDTEELKTLLMKIIENKEPIPVEKSRNFFDNNFNKRITEINDKNIIQNLINKKEEIFNILDDLEFKLNFDIQDFRKEFNLPKENYSDEFLLLKYKENNQNKTKTFYSIINQNN